MSKRVKIIPLKGIQLDGKEINLYSSKSEIQAILGNANTIQENVYYYFDHDLSICFSENDTVEFIEFLGGIDGELQPEIDGIQIFQENADTVFDFLKNKNNGAIDDNNENGYSYCFSN